MKHITRMLSQQNGQAVLMAAFALFALLAVLGLAVDLGRLVVVKAQLAKAVDSAALSGARVLPTGRASAERAAYEYGEMNFRNDFMGTTGHSFAVSFSPDPSKARVLVNATTDMPTTFLRLVGIESVVVRASAEAERRPLSIAMVLDNSGSLNRNFNGKDAIGFLRVAAEEFVRFFDDHMDKMSLSLFSTGTETRFRLGHDFTSPMISTIKAMTDLDNTNLSDGLAAGRIELRSDPDPASFRALVFFTDGRPTALRGVFPAGGTSYDAVIKGDQNPTGSVDSQLFRFDRLHTALSPTVRYTAPTFPDGTPRTVPNLQNLANQNLRAAAAAARRDGITIFAIGLGNPRAAEPWKQPDARLLIEIANAPSGVDPQTGGTIDNPNYDPTQPEGAFYYTEDAEELRTVFEQVAREIVLRLTL